MNKQQILKNVADGFVHAKNDNYLDACESLKIAIDLMHMSGKTGKPL